MPDRPRKADQRDAEIADLKRQLAEQQEYIAHLEARYLKAADEALDYHRTRSGGSHA